MTPGARLAAAIEIVEAYLTSETALAGALLAEWARGARYAGSKDRAAVADLAYAALRRLESARLGAPLRDGRAALLGALRLEGAEAADLAELADGGPHRPAPLSVEETAWLERLPEAVAAAEEPLDFPAWLRPELARSVADPRAESAALSRRAALDFRVNTLKTDLPAAAAALAAAGIATEPAPLSPIGLRAALDDRARPKLSRLAPYLEGLVEPQDAGSQAAALIAAAALAAPDGRAIDLCAGGGGKTLALAAAAPRARLLAYDVAPRRLEDLPPRLARAGARAEILSAADLSALGAAADLALVDAPCSGSGAWARQPDAKWRLTPARLEALGRAQDQALDLGAGATRPGGTLVYVTCSLLWAENEAALARFRARRPDFAPAPIAPIARAAGLVGLETDPEATALRLSPASCGVDGFFISVLRRAR